MRYGYDVKLGGGLFFQAAVMWIALLSELSLFDVALVLATMYPTKDIVRINHRHPSRAST